MGFELVVAPTVEPISLARGKAHLRVEVSDDDAIITDQILASRVWAEDYTHRKIINQTWDLTLDSFPNGAGMMELPFGRTQSVTSITYTTTAGATATLSGPSSASAGTDWQEDLSSDNGSILAPSYGGSWPTARENTPGAVTIRFVAGYGAAAGSVPESLIRAMLYRLTDFYELRGSLDQPAFAGKLQSTAARVADEFVLRRF